MTEQSHIHLHPFGVRSLWAIFAFSAALISPIAALLGLHQIPPERTTDLIPGFVVGVGLFLFFTYLSIRAMRFGIALTDAKVCLNGILWDTKIPINQIALICEEEVVDETGHAYVVHVARNQAGRELFRLEPSYSKLANEIGLAIQVATKNSSLPHTLHSGR